MFDRFKDYKIILASTSPRRKALLGKLDIEFEVEKIHIEEIPDESLDPNDAAMQLARDKSEAFPEEKITPNTIVITADTIVCYGDDILGKPTSETEAKKMLERLSGDKHTVITGICLRSRNKTHTFSALTTVWFKDLLDDEIAYYVTKYSPLDKAGAYGIQEWIGHIGVTGIEGSYFNVMGLPVQKLYSELCNFIGCG